MARDLGVPVAALIGNRELLAQLDRARYQSADVGSFTLDDILAELLRPGRDPRRTFEPPRFREDVSRLEDLRVGMSLEGVVTNVTAFGAFVDVGVHQDGLVHVSRLADRFVKDPSEVVKVGDRLSVRVLEVDLERGRISLSAVRGDGPAADGIRAESAPGRGGAVRAGAGQGARPGRSAGRPGGQPGAQGSKAGPPAQGLARGELRHNPFAALGRK
jgi:uncharacterized protein